MTNSQKAADYWAVLRDGQIEALSADKRASVREAIDDLKRWLRKLSVLAHT